ncbi:gem-associated protein 2-like [Branchiostoma lanceolatum]|uniref:gem-associated protein 2-like n=1 Tax=Branchiostoma lanceolatum TaxID=7740 RepID=UPI0034535C53
MDERDELGDLQMPAFLLDDPDVEILEEYDPDIPASNPLEYLQRVRQEAEKCPSVVVADIDVANFKDKQTVLVSPSSGFIPAEEGFAPTIPAQRKLAAQFSDVRQAYRRNQQNTKKGKTDQEQKLKLPAMKDENGWKRLCMGCSVSPEGSVEEGEEGRLEEGQEDTQDSTKEGHPPSLQILMAMDQWTVIQVLDFHITWLQRHGFSTLLSQWLYALMVCLEKPLYPDTAASLRTLSRCCSAIRATLDSKEDDRLAPLNLLICLVSRYFDQGDLADT